MFGGILVFAQWYNKVHSIHSLLQIWENHLLIRMKGAKKMERKDEALKSQVTIRCAKAAILLSSLKSFPNHHLTTSIDDQGEDKKKSEMEMMKTMVREIGDLKMELARERLKNKRIKLCGLMEVILQVMTVLSISTFLLVIVLMQG
ncbi:Retrotransposon-derived protein [Salix suchowensis]|nr:Retrotransposon-derived protein [Salix suchowensis]